MKQRRIHVWALPSMQRTKALLLISACCGLGILLGCLFALWTQDTGADALNRYIDNYLSLEPTNHQISFLLRQAWSVIKLPVLVVLLRFTVLGVLLIPILIGVKGVLLSFAVSAFVKCYGWSGEAAALLLFGCSAAIEMAVLLYLAVESWVFSREQCLGMKGRVRSERGFRAYLICFFALLLDIAVQNLSAEWIETMLRALLNA